MKKQVKTKELTLEEKIDEILKLLKQQNELNKFSQPSFPQIPQIVPMPFYPPPTMGGWKCPNCGVIVYPNQLNNCWNITYNNDGTNCGGPSAGTK